MRKGIKTDSIVDVTDAVQQSLRPTTLAEYIGQDIIRTNLDIAIASAKARGTVLDHILLYGPPGLGKTTLAYLIAAEMGTTMVYVAGPTIVKAGDIVSVLNRLQTGDVLFIDEIHRISIQAEEVLYSAMEDGYVSISVGEGGQSRLIRLELEPFTLVGATTRAGMLSQPLRDRFGHSFRLDYYTENELAAIIQATADKMSVSIDPAAALSIAKASRGTPRIANRNMARVRDYMISHDISNADMTVVCQAMTVAGIDERGLDIADRKYLDILARAVHPTGLSTLSDMTGEDIDTIELGIEPYLLRAGYIEKTARGRIITSVGRYILGMPENEPSRQMSFSEYDNNGLKTR